MNGFLRRLTNYDLVEWLALERKQQGLEIERLRGEMDRMQLSHARNVRDILASVQHEIEEGDVDDLLERLEDGLRDMNDSVARLEEHA